MHACTRTTILPEDTKYCVGWERYMYEEEDSAEGRGLCNTASGRRGERKGGGRRDGRVRVREGGHFLGKSRCRRGAKLNLSACKRGSLSFSLRLSREGHEGERDENGPAASGRQAMRGSQNNNTTKQQQCHNIQTNQKCTKRTKGKGPG